MAYASITFLRDCAALGIGMTDGEVLTACSFFGDQEGDFKLGIRSIAAVKKEESAYRDDPDMRRSMEGEDEKRYPPIPAKQGWLGWLIGYCLKL
jgi:hypothetical protein